MKLLVRFLRLLFGETSLQRARPSYSKVWAVRPLFEPYDLVRVVKLLEPKPWLEGTKGVARAPEVGDVGVVIDLNDDSPEYCVECMDGDYTVWMADFVAEELEKAEDDVRATP